MAKLSSPPSDQFAPGDDPSVLRLRDWASACRAQWPATAFDPEESFPGHSSRIKPALRSTFLTPSARPLEIVTQQAMELFGYGSPQTGVADVQVDRELPVPVGIRMAPASLSESSAAWRSEGLP
jgi:hypothetical protein